ILDCGYGSIDDLEEMERMLNGIPGVVENGLFVGLATMVIAGTAGGSKTIRRR
ncbi:MAG: ribose-5-phosphate isomerase A, partial [Thermoplasmata archaeon]|nr:ribose-5-phosphate isomerase A [Thermoplasmata archaeon]